MVNNRWTHPGKINSVEIIKETIVLQSDNCKVHVHFLLSDLFQVQMIRPGEVVKPTWAVEHRDWPETLINLQESSTHIEVTTECLQLIINLNPFNISVYDRNRQLISSDFSEQGLGFETNGSKVRVIKSLDPAEKFYGLGERPGFLNKRGERHELWNYDQSDAHVHSTKHLYKSIPMLLGMRGTTGYGIFFDNSFMTRFDLGKESEDYFYFEADGGALSYYFFYGPAFKNIIRNYTALTGRTELPPLWSLGFHQSRYSYYPESKVQQLAKDFRNREIPCDVIHLDIDYMDGYRVFTWDTDKFPNPERLLKDLGEQGFKVVTIIDPGVKKDPDYELYQEGVQNQYFCTDPEGNFQSGEVWPGNSLFPDFSQSVVRKWWAEKNSRLRELGVAGIWNDMNEPAVFNGEMKTLPLRTLHQNDGQPITHAEFHNLYGNYMCLATRQGLLEVRPNERPFILNRASFAGIQRIAAVWTGDNRSYWEHLALSVPMLTTLGLCGVTFAGSDIGGFSFDTNPELYARWIQLGICYPFMRAHSDCFSKDQEPWNLGSEVEAIAKEYISLRYQLLPYIYNLFYEASLTGMPLMRPMFLAYQDDPVVHNLNDQFMFGDALLVAPVCVPGVDCRAVYLPEGEWYNYHTGELVSGGDWVLAQAPLNQMPIFVKGGSLIPIWPVINYVGETEIKELTLMVYPGEDMEYKYYEDDGISFDYEKGVYNLIRFSGRFSPEQIDLTITPEIIGYTSTIITYRLVIKEYASCKECAVLVNGKEVEVQSQGKDLIVKISSSSLGE